MILLFWIRIISVKWSSPPPPYLLSPFLIFISPFSAPLGVFALSISCSIMVGQNIPLQFLACLFSGCTQCAYAHTEGLWKFSANHAGICHVCCVHCHLVSLTWKTVWRQMAKLQDLFSLTEGLKTRVESQDLSILTWFLTVLSVKGVRKLHLMINSSGLISHNTAHNSLLFSSSPSLSHKLWVMTLLH